MDTYDTTGKSSEKVLADPLIAITNWHKVTSSFHKQFGALIKRIDTIEQQIKYIVSANSKLEKLKKTRTESVQVLEYLVSDMDSQQCSDQESPQAFVNRLVSHTTCLKKQTEKIQHVMRLNKFQPTYDGNNNAAWSYITS